MQAGKRTWDSGNWRPDTRASLGLAVAAALLVTAGFAALFYATPALKLSRDTDKVREQLVLAEPRPSLPTPRPRFRIPAAPARLPLLQSAWPPLPTPIAAPGGFGIRGYLDERAQQNAAALRDQVTGSELKRDLGEQTGKPAISDNQSYRTVDGQKIVRSGADCAQIQTVQGSSSPTNRIEIAEPTTGCPGRPSEQEQIGKALQDWADKHRPPPP